MGARVIYAHHSDDQGQEYRLADTFGTRSRHFVHSMLNSLGKATDALKNGKHEKFVKEIFIGNKNNADAYRAVYGEQQSVFAASASANRLLKSAKIIARISELQAQVAEKHEITVDSMIKEFAETAAEAKAEKQYGPAMTGLTAIAKLAGLWVDRSENLNGNYAISDKPLSEQEWVEKHIKH